MIIMKAKESRSMEVIKLAREVGDRLGHNKRDLLTVKNKEQNGG